MQVRTRESGRVTRLRKRDPSLVWFAEECQNNHVRIEALIRHAERVRDPELAAFFRRAQAVGQELQSAAS